MKMKCVAVLALGTLISACGDDSLAPDRGDVVVSYDFEDSALIERASVFLVEGEQGMSCANAPFYEEDGVSPIARRDLPLTGEAEFSGIERGNMWIAWIVGSTSVGAPVSFDCQDFIEVRDGEVTRTSLLGRTRPLTVAGTYESDLTFDFNLPNQALSVLTALDAACSIFNFQEEACDLVDAMNTTLSDLDVVATWTVTQSDEFVNGRMVWSEVEGVAVKGDYRLSQGGFRGRISGTDDLEIVSEDLRVNMDEVLRFVLVEVLQTQTNAGMIDTLVDAADTFTTDLDMSAGDASVVDFDFDWEADSFNGTFDMAIELPQLEQSRELEIRWSAERVLSDSE